MAGGRYRGMGNISGRRSLVMPAYLGSLLPLHWIRDFLKDNYPLLKGAARFYLDNLQKDREGYLVTNPSESFENSFKSPMEKQDGHAWELLRTCRSYVHFLKIQ